MLWGHSPGFVSFRFVSGSSCSNTGQLPRPAPSVVGLNMPRTQRCSFGCRLCKHALDLALKNNRPIDGAGCTKESKSYTQPSGESFIACKGCKEFWSEPVCEAASQIDKESLQSFLKGHPEWNTFQSKRDQYELEHEARKAKRQRVDNVPTQQQQDNARDRDVAYAYACLAALHAPCGTLEGLLAQLRDKGHPCLELEEPHFCAGCNEDLLGCPRVYQVCVLPATQCLHLAM